MITRKQVLIGIAVLVAIGLVTTLIILLTKPGGGPPPPGPSPNPPPGPGPNPPPGPGPNPPPSPSTCTDACTDCNAQDCINVKGGACSWTGNACIPTPPCNKKGQACKDGGICVENQNKPGTYVCDYSCGNPNVVEKTKTAGCSDKKPDCWLDVPMNNDADSFTCCKNTTGGAQCCLWPGCVACGFAADGSVNTQNIYLLYLNEPKKCANFFYQIANLDGSLDLWKKPDNAGTFPMFSNEVGHDWTVDLSKKGIDSLKPGIVGNPSSTTRHIYGTTAFSFPGADNLCLAMKYNSSNGYISGTFDGFGIWEWDMFCAFLDEFSRLTGIEELGIYDSLFLMPHWLNAPTVDTSSMKHVKKLHLYLGGWPNLTVSVDDYNKENYPESYPSYQLWMDVVKFCKNQPMINYVYMDIDASGQNLVNNTGSFLTSDNIARMGNELAKVSTIDTLGAVITCNPKYGYVIPTYKPGQTGTPQSIEQPGGFGANPSNWKTPSRPSGIDPNNSACAGVDYCPVDQDPSSCTGGRTGCPNEIQNAMYVMQQANLLLKKNGSQKLFTRFIQDGENNGSGTSQYCVWWNSFLNLMGPDTELNMDPADMRMGQAFTNVTVSGDLYKEAMANNFCANQTGKSKVQESNFITLPELYWNTDLIKNGLKNYDDLIKSNKDLQKLQIDLTSDGMKDSAVFLKNGVGCEGCDHNHVAPARASRIAGTGTGDLEGWGLRAMFKKSSPPPMTGAKGGKDGNWLLGTNPPDASDCGKQTPSLDCNDPKNKCTLSCYNKINQPCQFNNKGTESCQSYITSYLKDCNNISDVDKNTLAKDAYCKENNTCVFHCESSINFCKG